jgi:hypothetical protein
MAIQQMPEALPSAWGKNALRGTPVKGGMTMEGMSTPLYDPRTLKFIGWEDQSGRQMALPSQGLVPDYFNPQAAQGQAGTQAPAVAPGFTPSYYPGAGGGGNWATSGWAQGVGIPGAPGAPGVPGAPATAATEVGGGGGSMATTSAAQIPTSVSLPEWQAWYGQNVGKTILVNGQPRTIGQDISPDDLLSSFRSNQVGWGQMPGPSEPATPVGGAAGVQPETVGLQQMAQIDPQSEALRQAVGGSYLQSLQQAQNPTAAQFQTYLDMYKQLDPTAAAARQALGQRLSSQYALGTQLDPGTIREVEQGVRSGQAARGNVYGTPQLVAETMARGQMGEQRQQQRMQNLASYLQSGISPGDVALNLYNQQQQNLRANQGAALSYLGSGQTPYQAGASYYDRAQQQAAMAAQGGPQYNPQALGQGLTGSAQQFPQYGLNIGQQANQWYNSLAAYGGAQGAPQKNKTTSALGGAASGALSGATAGTAVYPGIGTLIGAGVGALAGGAGGYFS